ncbi:hypothetical protein ACFSJW_07490 [Flavobacterium artemisiae]|uniref:Uncharacterized protein n=1 Tax=Flavobacterium artemisiae TaxID=2126556 RepID=A0ABW4HD69_9FLAO
MEKSLVEQYFDVRNELKIQIDEFERESKIEITIIKVLIVLLVAGSITFCINI